MPEVIEFPVPTYAYACEKCECCEVVCFTDGDVMCNECGDILDIEVKPRTLELGSASEH